MLSLNSYVLRWAGICFGGLMMSVASAAATPSVLIDVDTGAIIAQEDASQPWYPASLTKLMTVYVTLDIVREKNISLDTPLTISARSLRVPPSRMGFKPGTEITLDIALKILMVKSANDIAVAVAEAMAGSVEDFAARMNATARRLGMANTHFVNPNGLQNPEHVSSARDMAILGRALLHDFPERTDLYNIGALELEGKVLPTHNGLLGRYPGADGMKTGFTCSSGFNIVASATQNGRRLMAVVLGYNTAKSRTQKVAALFDYGFRSGSAGAPVESLPAGQGMAPDRHSEACPRRGHRDAVLAAETEDMSAPIEAVHGFLGNSTSPADIARLPRPTFAPLVIATGRPASWTGTVLSAQNPAVRPAPAPAPAPASATAYLRPDGAIEDAGQGKPAPLRPDPAANPMNLNGAVTSPPLPPLRAGLAKSAKPALKMSAKANTSHVRAGKSVKTKVVVKKKRPHA